MDRFGEEQMENRTSHDTPALSAGVLWLFLMSAPGHRLATSFD
jgi:hypothetical protein